MHILIVGGSPRHLGGVEAFCDRSSEALLNRSSHIRIGRIPAATAFLSLRRLPAFVTALAKLVVYRRHRPDLVWLQYVNLPDLAFLLLARLLGQRVMVTPHLGANWRSQSNSVLRYISGQILGLADRIALISHTQTLEINLPISIPRSLIRNFLPKALFGASDTDPSSHYNTRLELVHSGRLSVGKGTLLLIEVCDKLKRAGVAFRARITGTADAETQAAMHARIAELDLRDTVYLLGRVSDEELIDILKTSDVLVHLSRIDSYPLIVLESIACSVFPVCMELAGARDMIETYDGFVCSTRDPIQETVDFLRSCDIQELRRRGIAAGAGVRRDYDWAVCAEALERALTAVAHRHRE